MSQNSLSSHSNNSACQLLYDPDLLKTPSASLLNGDIFRLADSSKLITSGGRGQAWFIEIYHLSTVLRAYQRGGLIARFNQQTYLGFSAEQSRAFKEWRLLQWMFTNDLPVPRPVAASVCRWPFAFMPFYRAHILIERIPAAQTLDHLLETQLIDNQVWQTIGRCIRQFHNANVYHADLNASNILVDDNHRVFLIDFDKGEIRADQQQAATWKKQNLARLRRSLLKQQGLHSIYHFSEENWRNLIAAYDKNGQD